MRHDPQGDWEDAVGLLLGAGGVVGLVVAAGGDELLLILQLLILILHCFVLLNLFFYTWVRLSKMVFLTSIMSSFAFKLVSLVSI